MRKISGAGPRTSKLSQKSYIRLSITPALASLRLASGASAPKARHSPPTGKVTDPVRGEVEGEHGGATATVEIPDYGQPQAAARLRKKSFSRSLRMSPAARSNWILASASRPARNKKPPLAAGRGAQLSKAAAYAISSMSFRPASEPKAMQ